MAIVPADSELDVHVKVAPTDIDRITVGQTARMRFTAFNRQTTPEIVGAVDVIPAATVVDKATNLPFYKTSVTFSPEDLGELATKLTPGMPSRSISKPRNAPSYPSSQNHSPTSSCAHSEKNERG